MQKDFFDDQQRDVVNAGDLPPPEAVRHASKVIDAEVVEETEATPPHFASPPADIPASRREKLLLFAFVAVLLGSILLLQGQTKALQATTFAETPSLNVPVIVRYAPIEQSKTLPLTQDERIHVSFAEITANAATLRKSVVALARPDIPVSNEVLSEADYKSLKKYLAQKEGLTNEDDVRDVLLQAGYKLPARLPDENHKAAKNKAHLSFARDVISKLLKQEVEDFLEKVQIASEVGVYVAETAKED